MITTVDLRLGGTSARCPQIALAQFRSSRKITHSLVMGDEEKWGWCDKKVVGGQGPRKAVLTRGVLQINFFNKILKIYEEARGFFSSMNRNLLKGTGPLIV